jgi:hypothetical protein
MFPTSVAHAYVLGVADAADANPAAGTLLKATVYRLVLDPAVPLETYDARIAAHRSAGQEPQLVVGGTGTTNHAASHGVVDYAVSAAERWPYAYSISVINEPNESGIGVCEYARTYLAAYRALHALGVRRILFGEWAPGGAIRWHIAVLTRCKNTSPFLREIVTDVAWHAYWTSILWGPGFRAIARQLHMTVPRLYATEAGAVLHCNSNLDITSATEANRVGVTYWRMALSATRRDRLTEVVVWELHSPGPLSHWDSGLIEPDGGARSAFAMIANRQ